MKWIGAFFKEQLYNLSDLQQQLQKPYIKFPAVPFPEPAVNALYLLVKY